MKLKSVCRRTVTVNLENGLHMVPCSRIAQTAVRFPCEIRIHKDELIVDAKDIFALLSLSADKGTRLVLEADGDDAAEAVDRLAGLFDSNFADDSSREH